MHASLFSAVCFSFAYGQKYIRHNTDNRDRRWSYGVQKPPFHPHPGFGCRYNRRIPHHSRKIRSFRRRMRFCFSCSSFCSGSILFLALFCPLSQLLKIKNPPCRVKQELKTLAQQGQSPLSGFVLPAFRAKAAQRGLHSRRRSRAQYFNLWV